MSKLGKKDLLTVYAKHPPYTDGHLGEVMNEMDVLGAPSIRVVDYRGEYFAIEGSHRLASAYIKGIAPNLIIEDQDRLTPEDEDHLERVKGGLPKYTWEI